MARLTVHSVATAPEAAKARVEAAEKNNGFLPNLIGVLANSPAALAMYQDVNGTKRLIKRRKLDEYLDKAFSI